MASVSQPQWRFGAKELGGSPNGAEPAAGQHTYAAEALVAPQVIAPPRRSALLASLALGLLGLAGTACADARGNSVARSESTSPHVGEALNNSTAEQRSLSTHLAAQGAIFYGAWWCPACFQQKNLFGKEAGNSLPYVECDKSDEGRQRCQAAEVRAFPTWDLKGKPRLEGVQSLDALKAWSNYSGSSRTAQP